MCSIKKKLHNKCGASMMLALMFMLIVMLLGAVVLAAASGAIGKSNHVKQDQQHYLAVSSAARLITSEVNNLEFKAWWWTVTTTHSPTDPNTGEVHIRHKTDYHPTNNDIETEGSSIFSQTTGSVALSGISKNFEAIYLDDLSKNANFTALDPFAYSPNSSANIHNLSIEAPTGSIGGKALPNVQGEITVEADYTIIVELWTELGSKNNFNKITLTFEPDKSPSHESDGNTEYYYTTVTWPDSPVIIKGGA